MRGRDRRREEGRGNSFSDGRERKLSVRGRGEISDLPRVPP